MKWFYRIWDRRKNKVPIQKKKQMDKELDEVIDEYRSLARQGKMDSESSRQFKLQLNAVFFMKDWVLSGGHTDEDGNRVCLVW